jgi:hypothetical protein
MSGTDTLWRIHAAQVDWTGRVDAKASFAFGLESAALGLVVALSSPGRTYATLDGWLEPALYWSGILLLLAAALLSLLVVVPRLRHRAVEAEAGENYIYFGHVQHWSPDALAERAIAEDDLAIVLARQCVTMAKIAWRKHRLVQLSMIAGASGIGALVFTAAITSK